MGCITWMDSHQGSIMCILTFSYLLVTLFIFRSNKKAVDAANRQIVESQKMREDALIAQKQNTALQLLDQRIEIYKLLQKWIISANIISTDDKSYKESLPILRSVIFPYESGPSLDASIKLTNDLNALTLESKIIQMAQICFSPELYPPINSFVNAFWNMALYINNEIRGIDPMYTRANTLKEKTKEINKENIIDQMMKEMKEVQTKTK